MDDLIAVTRTGKRLKYVYFWGHRPRPDGSIGKSCLSQWWVAPFVVDGIRYPTAEHWMMAGKARTFGDEVALKAILACGGAPQAKALGRTVRGFDEARWAKVRFELVVQGSVAKFESDARLRSYLLGTHRRVLVEASPHDRIWGIGLDERAPEARDPARWRGLNLLGFALMEARERL